MTTRRQQRRQGRKTRMRRLAALVMAATVACGAGMATSTALADEPQRCGTADSVCYAGYNANGLKQIADDLSEHGKDSQYYTTMYTSMQYGRRGEITLSDGSTLPFRLIGILHDDLADGSGRKAGLTFIATAAMPTAYCMNGTMPDDDTTTCTDGKTSAGGWRDSGLRGWMNDDNGPIWSMFPQSFRDNVSTVVKQSGWSVLSGDGETDASEATSDRLWIVSKRELVGDGISCSYDLSDPENSQRAKGCQARQQEGDQYELFERVGVVSDGYNSILSGMYMSSALSMPAGSNGTGWWIRSTGQNMYYSGFLKVAAGGAVSDTGEIGYNDAPRLSVVPAFSF